VEVRTSTEEDRRVTVTLFEDVEVADGRIERATVPLELDSAVELVPLDA
jgi:hypothetical protein